MLTADPQPDAGISRLMQIARERGDIPALAVATLSPQEILSFELQGVRVAGGAAAVNAGDFFHIGSCGKSVLAVIAGRLVEEGKIDWGSRLLDLLPAAQNAALPDYAAVTLEDLFVCKGGIAAYISDDEKFPDINPTSPHPRLAFARYLLAQPPAAARDATGKFEHVYSNAGYTLISLMLEQASGLTWEDSVARLSTALGLEMRVGWPADHGADQPWGHGQDSEGQPKVFAPDDPYRLSTLIAPAGNIAMRPLDYARYVQLHAQGLAGTDNYLRAATYRHIHLGHQGFSLGVGNGKYVGKLVSQFDGSAGTFYCHSIVVHGADLAYVVLANAGTPHVVSAIYGLSAAILKQRFGKWWKFWV